LAWTSYIGFEPAWTFSPTSLHLGEDVRVVDTTNSTLELLMFKGVLYFLVSIQLSIVMSRSFLKFYDKVLFENASKAEKIGIGLAYRRNNFKNEAL
jgi:hypothetical protein